MVDQFVADDDEVTRDNDEVVRPFRSQRSIVVKVAEGELLAKIAHMTGESSHRRSVHSILSSSAFDGTTATVIIVNLFTIAHEANVTASGEAVPTWLALSGNLFLVFYILELALKLFAWRSTFFDEAANCMDLCVVVADVLGTVIQIILPKDDSRVPSFSVIRFIRLLRLARLLRAFKVFRRSRELSVMLAGMAGTFRAIFYGLMVVFATLLLWSIVAVEVLHPVMQELGEEGVFEDQRTINSYGSVARAFLTLYQQAFVADDWSTISTPLMERSPFIAAPILCCVFVTTQLGFLNLVLTAIVDSAHETRLADEEKESFERSRAFEKAKKDLVEVCATIDANGNGSLELEELLEGFDTNEKFKSALSIIDVQRDDILNLYNVLDADADGQVSYQEFVDQLHSMKSEETKLLIVYMKAELATLHEDVLRNFQLLKQDIAMHSKECGQLKKDITIHSSNLKEKIPSHAISSMAADQFFDRPDNERLDGIQLQIAMSSTQQLSNSFLKEEDSSAQTAWHVHELVTGRLEGAG